MTRAVITPALLQAVGAKAANATTYAPLLDKAAIIPRDAFNSITSRTGVAMLVAQLAHESGGFSAISENLNYRAEALVPVFGPHRISPQVAALIGRTDSHPADQEAIANTVYGGVYGVEELGNTQPGDGWRFRGGGLIQLTGRENYAAFAAAHGIALQVAADYVRTPEGAVASALWFWRTRGLINPAYRGDVSTCTRIINGGTNGLADRLARYRNALDFLEMQAAERV